MTTQHPLNRGDQQLAQDYMLTKITLFLARDADDADWEHEIHEQAAISTGIWAEQNAFLFGFTLARVVAATQSEHDNAPFGSDADALRRLVDSAAGSDFAAARAAWNEATQPDTDTPENQATNATLNLIHQLRAIHDTPNSWGTLDRLPPGIQ